MSLCLSSHLNAGFKMTHLLPKGTIKNLRLFLPPKIEDFFKSREFCFGSLAAIVNNESTWLVVVVILS